jgi:hypothetical protein
MITDTTKVQESLIAIVNYNWDDEKRHFEEYYEVDIQSQDELEPWITWCEQHTDSKACQHVFYHLMVLKQSYPDLFIH